MTPSDEVQRQPLLFKQSQLDWVDLDNIDLPRTNADGESVIEPTPEQRYLFDTQGWLLIPGLIDADEVEQMREYCERLHAEPDSMEESQAFPDCRSAGEADRPSLHRRLHE